MAIFHSYVKLPEGISEPPSGHQLQTKMFPPTRTFVSQSCHPSTWLGVESTLSWDINLPPPLNKMLNGLFTSTKRSAEKWPDVAANIFSHESRIIACNSTLQKLPLVLWPVLIVSDTPWLPKNIPCLLQKSHPILLRPQEYPTVSPHSPIKCLVISILFIVTQHVFLHMYIYIYTLWKFNIAMENGHS